MGKIGLVGQWRSVGKRDLDKTSLHSLSLSPVFFLQVLLQRHSAACAACAGGGGGHQLVRETCWLFTALLLPT